MVRRLILVILPVITVLVITSCGMIIDLEDAFKDQVTATATKTFPVATDSSSDEDSWSTNLLAGSEIWTAIFVIGETSGIHSLYVRDISSDGTSRLPVVVTVADEEMDTITSNANPTPTSPVTFSLSSGSVAYFIFSRQNDSDAGESGVFDYRVVGPTAAE